jgi:hypothetical protein
MPSKQHLHRSDDQRYEKFNNTTPTTTNFNPQLSFVFSDQQQVQPQDYLTRTIIPMTPIPYTSTVNNNNTEFHSNLGQQQYIYERTNSQTTFHPQFSDILRNNQTYGFFNNQVQTVACPLIGLGICNWHGPPQLLSAHVHINCLPIHYSRLSRISTRPYAVNSRQQIIVQIREGIETMMLKYLSLYNIISQLRSIAPDRVILAVWNRMKLENPEFFHAYEQRLLLRQQCEIFNELLQEIIQLEFSSRLDDTIQSYQNYQIEFENILPH